MSPREIPGVPFGKLPDKRSKGICLECFREFRSVKVLKESNGETKHLCPYCGSQEIVMEED